MVSMTLAVPLEMKKEMDERAEINWSEVARTAIRSKLALLNKFEEFTRDSTLTEEDTLRLSRAVNKKLAKRYASLERG
ncbi:MAG: hypothetical protein V1722_04350 [Candidatus Micrarchaeota archaeon]